MENQEKENIEPIIPIVDHSPILDENDYRVTGNDYFDYCVGSSINLGPSLSEGENAIKDFLKLVAKANREEGDSYVRAYPPTGFTVPQEWIDEIFNV